MLATALTLALGLSAPPTLPAAPAVAKSTAVPGANQGPLDFRCDGMQVYSKPNRVVCRGHVIVRRSDLLVCCEVFEGLADAQWAWEKFVCSEDVRAHRGDELMWSDQATFVLDTSDLVLTGRPKVQRGQSVLEGERIHIDVKNDSARVELPRGRIEPAEVKEVTPLAADVMTAPLPSTCPVPAAKGRLRPKASARESTPSTGPHKP